jgi:hypothetical protein|tara:strand:+ start:1770 stop:1955 length:186 start_codon:yes stop_codon:yes gene_type:complete
VKQTTWEVVDITSSPGLPSENKVIARFDSLKEANELAVTDDRYKIRTKREKQRGKDEEENS